MDGSARYKPALALLVYVFSTSAWSATWWVATDGSDDAAGTDVAPLRTIQAALDVASGGDVINVRSGIYPEALLISRFADNAKPLTLQAAPDATPVLDGTTIGAAVAISLPGQQNITIRGFEIRHYSASGEWQLAAGIYLHGASSGIAVVDNHIHHISSVHPTSPIANGIGVYGTSPTPSNDILIDGNTLHDLTLGWSESLVVNGNVDGFTVQNNSVHNNDNIGIDIIGFEQWIVDGGVPAELNRARNGAIVGNHVYNIDSKSNPVYGGSRSAGAIYVDGGTGIRIERNVVQNSNIGVELASESPLGQTSDIDMFDNVISGSHLAGIALGGYRAELGTSTAITIHHNTLYDNTTDPGNGFGEIWLQHNVIGNEIRNNIVHAAGDTTLIHDLNNQLERNSLADNLYYADGRNGVVRQAGDETPQPMTNPKFHRPATNDLRIEVGSPAETDATATHGSRAVDLQGRSRVVSIAPLLLPHNSWRMFSLPAAAPELRRTAQSVIGDDIPTAHGASDGWVMYHYDALAGRYESAGPDTTMAPGEAYWILQNSGEDITLQLPADSRPVARRQSSACSDSDGCFEHPLNGRENADQWVMLGYPFNSDTPLAQLRVTAAEGACAVPPGCGLQQAAAAQLLHDEMWWYDGTSYRALSVADHFSPWQGVWARVQAFAFNADAALLISR